MAMVCYVGDDDSGTIVVSRGSSGPHGSRGSPKVSHSFDDMGTVKALPSEAAAAGGSVSGASEARPAFLRALDKQKVFIDSA
jgi:hypothetical protein